MDSAEEVEGVHAAGGDTDSSSSGSDAEEPASGSTARNFQRCKEDFVCGNCSHLEQGDGYTNHCSQCLWSKHVDINPGDRAAECQGLMPPVILDSRKGGYRFLQRCLDCGHERWNKAQTQDSFDAVLAVSSHQDEGGGAPRGRRGGGGGGGGKRGRGKASGRAEASGKGSRGRGRGRKR